MSFEYKVLAATIACFSTVIASYLYYRHNSYCEPGVYTLFAIAEYCFVVSNIAFHSTLLYDFSGKRLTLTSSLGGGHHYDSLLPILNKDT